MKKWMNKISMMFVTLTLVLGLLPMAAVPVMADGEGTYREYTWDTDTQTLSYEDKTIPSDAVSLESGSTSWGSGNWYVVPAGGVTISNRITVTGTANLILTDGATLTATKGITVASGDILNIYGQSEGTGKLTIASTADNDAGIGSTNADTKSWGTVIIYGGDITVKGGETAAGIGGSPNEGNGGEITIFNGKVNATGQEGGAGIGGGNVSTDAGTVTIYGGMVTAIGSAPFSNRTASSGIGGGAPSTMSQGGNGGDVYIYGGDVTTTAGSCRNGVGSGIGGGYGRSNGSLTLGPNVALFNGATSGSLRLDQANPIDTDGKIGDETYTGSRTQQMNTRIMPSVNYITAEVNPETHEVTPQQASCEHYNILTGAITSLPGGWYVVDENTTITSRITISDTVNLILCDDVTLNANAGITTTGATLNIYAQSTGDAAGTLIATGVSNGAGIGGGNSGSGGTINIYGGMINATGGEKAAGIGGGSQGTGGNVSIIGGIIRATGNADSKGYGGAGIGGGYMADCGSIHIYDGNVIGIGGTNGAGIGSGLLGRGGTVTIDGGDVTGTGGADGDGLGGAQGGCAGVVIINGGKLTATGDTGIYCDSLTVNNSGDVEANGIGDNGEGIRIRISDLNGVVALNGGSIRANGTNIDGIKGNVVVTEGFLYTTSDEYCGIYGNVTANGGEVIAGAAEGEKGIDGFINTGTGMYIWESSDNDNYSYKCGSGNNWTSEARYVKINNTPPHTHEWSYTANGAVITATCSGGDDCPLHSEWPTLTLSAAGKTYDGTSATAVYTPTANWNAENGLDPNPTITYKQGDTVLDSAPTNAGTYTANITLDDATASVTYTIEQKPVTVTGGLTAADKVYDGSADATIDCTGAVIDGKLDPDELTVGSAAGAFADASAGEGKTVTISNITLAGAAAGNYVLAESGHQTSATATITKKDVTITGLSAAGKTYDGTAAATITGTAAIDGIVDGDSADVTVTAGSASFADAAAGNGKTVTFSGYSLTGDKAGNYNLTAQPANVTADITKKDLSVTAKDKTITYGDAPANDGVTYDGFIDGEDETDLGGALTYAYDYEQNDPIGEYDITPGGLTSENYEINYVPGTLTVLKADSTVTTAPTAVEDLIYAGADQALVNAGTAVGGTVQYALGSDAETQPEEGWSAIVPTGNAADTYYVWWKVVGDGNHNDIPASCITVSIAPKDVTITGLGAEDKTYDGTTAAAVTGTAAIDGIVPGDSADVTVAAGSATFDNATAGTGKTVTFSGYSLTGDKAGNYNLTAQPASVTADITKKDLSITAKDKTITYGDAPSNDGVSYDGFITGEDESDLNGTLTYTYDYEQNGGVGTYNITPGGLTSENYEITFVNGILTVLKADSTVTAPTAVEDLVYAGADQALVNAGTAMGGTVQYALGEGEESEDEPTAGWNTEIPTGNAADTYYVWWKVVGDGNHNDIPASCITVSIAPKDVTITGLGAEDKTYDGTTAATINGTAEIDGIVPGDSADVTVAAGSAAFSDAAAGEGKSVTFSGYSLTGDKAGNYNLTAQPESVTANITKKALSITAKDKTITYGAAPSNDGVTYDGFITGEDESNLDGTLAFSYNYEQKGDAGEYAITPSGLTSENYDISFVNGSLTVAKRSVTLTSASDTKVYDGKALTNSEVSVGGDGFADGEGATYDVTGTITLPGEVDNAFTYTLAEGTKEENYAIDTVFGKLTVTDRSDDKKFEITVKANSDTALYDGNEHTVSGFETLSFTFDDVPYTVEGLTAEAAGTDAGTYAAEVKGTAVVKDAADNDVTAQFNVRTENGTLTVNKRSVTLTSASDTKVYDGKALTNSEVSVGGDGFADGEGATYDVTGTITLPGEVDNAFTYTLSEGTKAENYAIDTAFGKLMITDRSDDKKFEITVKANSDTALYDGNEHTVNGIETLSFTFDDVPYTVEGLTAEAVGTDAGTYAAEVQGTAVVKDAAGNDVTNQFIVHTENGTLTINKRNVTLTSATDTKVYDGTDLTNSVVEVTEDGFAEGEGATYNVTGVQNTVGSSANTFTYALNEGTKEENYNITTIEGTLTVTSRDAKYVIVPEVNSGEFLYDGTEHSVSGFVTNTFIVEEKTYTVEGLIAEAARTDAGTSTVSVTGTAIVRDSDGADVSTEFSVEPVSGTLTVTKRNVTLTSGSAEKEYDGNALTNDTVTVGGDGFVGEEGATYNVTGSRTLAGTAENTFSYTLNEGTKAENYDITTVLGTLMVTPKAAPTDLAEDEIPKAKEDLVDNGESQDLVSEPVLPEGYTKVLYVLGDEDSIPDDAEWSESVPQGDTAGDYYVWYKYIDENGNHVEYVSPNPVKVPIAPAPDPTPEPDTYKVPVSNENTVQVEATIADGNAVLADITPETIAAIIGEEGHSTVDTIQIDLSGAEQEVKSIQLTKETLTALSEAAQADNNVDKVMIRLSKAAVVLDAATLAAVTEQATGDDIHLVVEEIPESVLTPQQQEALKDFTYVETFEVYFESDGEKIADFKGGNVVLSLAFTPEEGKDPAKYALLYLAPDGGKQMYPATIADGSLTAMLDHFSEYAIIYDDSEIVPPEPEPTPDPTPTPNPGPTPAPDSTPSQNTTPDTSDTAQPVVWLILLVLAGCAIPVTIRFAVKRK